MKIEIGFRQLGQNIILTIEGEQLSKRFADKKERESVKKAVEAYNALPKSKQTKRDLNAIKDMMSKEEGTSKKKSSPSKSKSKPKAEKKKAASKKESKKEAADEGEIGFRQLGQNIILEVEGEKLTKRFSEKSDREKLKSLVNEYNELPKSKRTKTKLKAIKAMMVKSATSTGTKTSKKKEEKRTTTQKKISGKQMGQNIILVVDGKKLSKRFPEKSDRTEVLELVQKYNKKNSNTSLDKILSMMEKDTAKGEDKVNKDTEKLKKSEEAPESTSKLSKEEEIERAKKLLEKNGHQVIKKTASSSRATRRRGGEY